MKINVIQPITKQSIINRDLLNNILGAYYLVMNSHTCNLLWRERILTENWNEKGVSYSEFGGIPIAICEKFQDGEIDVIGEIDII